MNNDTDNKETEHEIILFGDREADGDAVLSLLARSENRELFVSVTPEGIRECTREEYEQQLIYGFRAPEYVSLAGTIEQLSRSYAEIMHKQCPKDEKEIRDKWLQSISKAQRGRYR